MLCKLTTSKGQQLLKLDASYTIVYKGANKDKKDIEDFLHKNLINSTPFIIFAHEKEYYLIPIFKMDRDSFCQTHQIPQRYCMRINIFKDDVHKIRIVDYDYGYTKSVYYSYWVLYSEVYQIKEEQVATYLLQEII